MFCMHDKIVMNKKRGNLHMTNLNELIETANILSTRLEQVANEFEQAANDEKKFCIEICMKLEAMSWEIYRTANELEEIRSYI